MQAHTTVYKQHPCTSRSMSSLFLHIFLLATSLFLLFHYCSLEAEAKLTFPNAISSNMVLQRGNAVIFGKSDIAFGIVFVNDTAVQAGADGSFSYQFTEDPYAAFDLSANGLPANFTITPFNLTIRDADSSVEFTNLVFGDVYLCAGQSNMAMNLYGSFNSSAELADTNYPNIRLYSANYYSQWLVSGPGDFDPTTDFTAFSALCYFTGRNLHKQLGIPIGLVASAVSGTAIEFWSSDDAMAKCPGAVVFCTTAEIGLWWRTYIVPILQMRFSAIVWYQGESNELDPTGYQCRFPALIEDWRKKLQSLDLPFNFVQLAGFTEVSFYPQTRLAQAMALELPNTAMVSAIDLGDPTAPAGSIHPRNKQTIGYRMSKVILKQIYGRSIVAAGPEPAAHTNCTRIFVNTTSPLVSRGTEACDLCCNQSPFEIFDGDLRGWRRADYRIEGSSIVFDVCLDHKFVRYAMDDYPQCAIYNSEGFPMTPFMRLNPLSPATVIDLFAPFLFVPPLVLVLCVIVSIDAMTEKGVQVRVRALDFSSPFLFEVCAFVLHAARAFVFDRRFEALAFIAVTSHAMYGTKYAPRRYAWVVFSVIFTALTSLAGNGFRNVTFGSEQSDYLTYITIAPQALFFLYLLFSERRGLASAIAVVAIGGLIACAVTQSFIHCIFEASVYTVAIVACHQTPSVIAPDQQREDDELSIGDMEIGYTKANSPSQSPTEVHRLKPTDSTLNVA